MENYFSSNLVFLREFNEEKQEETATALSLSRSTYANYETGANLPKADTVLKIIGHFGVSFELLMSENLKDARFKQLLDEHKNRDKSKVLSKVSSKVSTQNEVNLSLKEDRVTYRMPAVVTVGVDENETVPFLPVRARAGYLNGYADPEFVGNLKTYTLPHTRGRTCRLFEVEGHSMQGCLESGDIVLGEWVESLDYIRDGRVYIFLLKNDLGVVIKRVLNRLNSDGKLILKSDNIRHKEDYPNLVIEPKDIAEVWYGVANLSRHFKEPGDIFNKVNDLEGRLTLLEHFAKNGK